MSRVRCIRGLESILDVEKETDQRLSELAESSLNLKADESSDDADEDEQNAGSRTATRRASATA